jgi:hypothetical protein
VCTRSLPRVAFSILLLSMTVAVGCTRKKPTPEEAGRLLSKRGSNWAYSATFVCREGEKQGEWDYLCQARFEPTPAADRFSKPLIQRVGVVLTDQTYKGEPLLVTTTFPFEGPIPSLAEMRRKSGR